MSRHDALTGLPNRVLLLERMEREAEGLRRNDELAVFCIDIGQFKQTNDALGHAVGDALLREIANRLRSCVREADAVARIGGVEFAILHVGDADTDELAKLAQHVLETLTKGYEIDSIRINICPTVGIARSPHDETTGAPLLRLANIALDRVKSEKRAGYRFFEAAMDSELQSRRRLEADLRRALVEEAFEVHYQPINDAKTRSIEVLKPWCAGAIPNAASCRPLNSFRWPKKPASSFRSANGC
jgi:diguanylate cyclase (GGDEF)-like protein